MAPTCQAGGYDIYRCEWCEETTQKNETAAVDHDYTELKETVAATCLAGGYDLFKCKWCEETTPKNETDPLGHQYGVPEWEWTGYTEAVAVFTCTRESCLKDAQGHKVEATATVTESGTEVTEDGTTVKVYTAKATFGGKDYTDQAKEPVQPIVPEPEKVKWTVTFIVYGGAWNAGTEGNIAVTLEGVEGETLKLAAKDIPAAGIVPFYGYTTGSWDEMPFDGMIITKDRTFTYTYEKKAANENLGNDQPGKDAEKPADDDDSDKIKFLREDIDDLLKLNQTTTKVNTLSLPASIAEHTISIGSPQVLQKDDVLPNAIRDARAKIDELSKSLSVRETLDKSNPPDAIRDAQSMINRILGSANVELSNNNGGSPTTKLRMALDEEGNLPELSVSANQSSEAEAKDPRLLVIRKLEEPGAKIVEGGERGSGAEGGNERDGMTAEDERAASTDRLIANIRETSETKQPAQGDADKQAASAGAGGSKDEDFAERDRQKAEEFEAHNSGKYDISGKKSFYVNEETGETSALITGKGDKISWLRESNDGTDAWYGFDSPTESKNALPDGSIVSVNWVSKENNPEEYEKKQLEIKGKGAAKLVLDSEAAHDNAWLFELNAYQQSTDDNGNVTWKKTDKGDFKDGMEVYIELGDDWDINDINAIWLDNQEQLSTPKIVTEEINGVSKRFAVLTLNGEKATDTADETGNTTTVTTDETGTTTTVTTNGNGGTGTVVTDKNGTIQFITTEKNGTRADYTADSSGLTLEKIETNDDQVDIPDEMKGADGKTYSVTAIAQGALEGNQQVTQTAFGSSIKNLQNQSMQGCKNLNNLILSIGQSKQ